ncbi:MAG: hypothetical protein Ct9H300mP27_09100 [Chloroflexota bacterium]|nr:MAG: hypothetical protein Ct9H300mP27_09100 [Chloroflexota bacterium]
MALPRVNLSHESYSPPKRNVVKHNRGTDVFEAGNIGFGFGNARVTNRGRWASSPCLTDLAGTAEKPYVEETEILAFDCFWDGPHYHYGPKKQEPSYLLGQDPHRRSFGVGFQQLDRHKLGSMIERAGYPGSPLTLTMINWNPLSPKWRKELAKCRQKVRADRSSRSTFGCYSKSSTRLKIQFVKSRRGSVLTEPFPFFIKSILRER